MSWSWEEARAAGLVDGAGKAVALGKRQPKNRAPTRDRKRIEDELQRDLVAQLPLLLLPDTLWFHPPQGGARSKVEAAIMVGLGARAGVSDLVFTRFRPPAGAWYLELKAPGGSPRKSQIEWWRLCRESGHPYAVAYDIGGALDALAQWGIMRAGVTP